MNVPPDEKEVDARLTGIAQAQTHARWAMLLGTLVSGAILTTLWNSYLSWDRRLATQFVLEPPTWGQKEVVAEQIRSWIETNTVTVELLGIRASISDAAVLGSLALIVCAFYTCMALRQENEEIGSLLVDALDYGADDQLSVFRRMHAVILFSRTPDSQAPYLSLKGQASPNAEAPLSNSVVSVLLYLPAVTILLIFLSDVYYALDYLSPFLANTSNSIWSELPVLYQRQLILMDTFAIMAFIITFRFCNLSGKYQNGTQAVLTEFAAQIKTPGEAPDSPTAT